MKHYQCPICKTEPWEPHKGICSARGGKWSDLDWVLYLLAQTAREVVRTAK